MTENEGALVSRAVDGDAEAYGKLYLRHLDAIYRYVYFKVGNRAQAEDLTEEVFVKAWEALPQYQIGESPFTSWLYRIAHNLTVDFFRRNRNEQTLLEETHNPIANPDQTPEQILVGQQDLEALVAAVGQLAPLEQEVLILRFVEGLSHRQVAESIGKSDGASRVIQHRALATVAKLLLEDQSTDGE